MRKRRYEILLPKTFNDGREVMHVCMECLPHTLMQVADQFGALSYQPQPIMGVWMQDGRRYNDELFKLTVDVDDTLDAHDFIMRFKAELLERFDQLEIYITSYAVEVI